MNSWCIPWIVSFIVAFYSHSQFSVVVNTVCTRCNCWRNWSAQLRPQLRRKHQRTSRWASRLITAFTMILVNFHKFGSANRNVSPASFPLFLHFKLFLYFLPRDAMLARYMLRPCVCVCICLSVKVGVLRQITHYYSACLLPTTFCPGRAIARSDDDFRTKWPLTYILDTLVHLDPISVISGS